MECMITYARLPAQIHLHCFLFVYYSHLAMNHDSSVLAVELDVDEMAKSTKI